MLVFVVLVASFDLLLGYTGIVSFAHTCSSASAPTACHRQAAWAPGWACAAVGCAAALASVLRVAAIGLFSLRVRAIFFSMITLASRPPSRRWPRSCRTSPAARTA
jgi:branched-chain amino acid transport system permease protein